MDAKAVLKEKGNNYLEEGNLQDRGGTSCDYFLVQKQQITIWQTHQTTGK